MESLFITKSKGSMSVLYIEPNSAMLRIGTRIIIGTTNILKDSLSDKIAKKAIVLLSLYRKQTEVKVSKKIDVEMRSFMCD